MPSVMIVEAMAQTGLVLYAFNFDIERPNDPLIW